MGESDIIAPGRKTVSREPQSPEAAPLGCNDEGLWRRREEEFQERRRCPAALQVDFA